MKVTLKTSAAGRARDVPVNSPQFIIGRAEDCNLRIQNPLVSRHHCVLAVEGDNVYARDLESRNGTGINNQRLAGSQRVHDGDILWVAATPLAVRIQREPARSRVKQTMRALARPFRTPAR